MQISGPPTKWLVEFKLSVLDSSQPGDLFLPSRQSETPELACLTETRELRLYCTEYIAHRIYAANFVPQLVPTLEQPTLYYLYGIKTSYLKLGLCEQLLERLSENGQSSLQVTMPSLPQPRRSSSSMNNLTKAYAHKMISITARLYVQLSTQVLCFSLYTTIVLSLERPRHLLPCFSSTSRILSFPLSDVRSRIPPRFCHSTSLANRASKLKFNLVRNTRTQVFSPHISDYGLSKELGTGLAGS